jgi:hypothetical protein
LLIGVLPYLFLFSLHTCLLRSVRELIPVSISFKALCVFVGFSIFQHFNFYVLRVIPDWVTNSLTTVVPRYMSVPYDQFGERGVQGWASEPSSAAMTCFAFAVVALRQHARRRWQILLLFTLLAAVNKSIYALVFLSFLAAACLWSIRRKTYALLVLIPIAGAFSFFFLQSNRVQMLLERVLPFGLNQQTSRELLRFAQILYPLTSFPRIYHPIDLFDLTVAPLGLLPLLIGYGSVTGLLLYLWLVVRSYRLAERGSLPLLAASAFVLSFMASPDFIPVIIAFLYALRAQPVPGLASQTLVSQSWAGKFAQLLAQSAHETA